MEQLIPVDLLLKVIQNLPSIYDVQGYTLKYPLVTTPSVLANTTSYPIEVLEDTELTFIKNLETRSWDFVSASYVPKTMQFAFDVDIHRFEQKYLRINPLHTAQDFAIENILAELKKHPELFRFYKLEKHPTAYKGLLHAKLIVIPPKHN